MSRDVLPRTTPRYNSTLHRCAKFPPTHVTHPAVFWISVLTHWQSSEVSTSLCYRWFGHPYCSFFKSIRCRFNTEFYVAYTPCGTILMYSDIWYSVNTSILCSMLAWCMLSSSFCMRIMLFTRRHYLRKHNQQSTTTVSCRSHPASSFVYSADGAVHRWPANVNKNSASRLSVLAFG